MDIMYLVASTYDFISSDKDCLEQLAYNIPENFTMSQCEPTPAHDRETPKVLATKM